MALDVTTKKYLDLAGLKTYDEKIKAYVDAAQREADGAAAQALVDAKAYTDGKIGSLDGNVATVAAAIAAEAGRADAAEKANKKAIEDEVVRATGVEGTLTNLTTEAKGNLVAAINEVDAHADAVTTLVGSIPEGATATTVVAYAKEVADAASGNASQVASDLAAEVTRAKAAEKAAQDAADAAQADVDALEALVGTGYEDKTVKAYIDAKVEEINGDADDLADRVKANEDAIDVINGEGEGSIKNAVNTAVTNLVDGAPEALDTLKEIADWISEQQASGEDGATQLVSKIEKNATAIAAEKTRAEGVEEGLQGAIDAINNTETGILKQAKEYANGLDTAMDARVDALEAAIGENGSVAAQISSAIEGLDATVVSQEATPDGNGLKVTVVEEDGKLKSVSVEGDYSKTYDALGAAEAAAKEAHGAIQSIDESDILALFSKAE